MRPPTSASADCRLVPACNPYPFKTGARYLRGRCAISHLPEPRLLDAAHIVVDADEQLGQPIVSNGLPLTKLHHAAFDAHLIGIDPDYRIHVSDRLLEIHDGPLLELGLK